MASYPNLLSIGALTEVREETVILNDSPRNLRQQWHRDVERYDDMVWHQVAQDFDERRPPLGPNVSDDTMYQRKAADDGGKKKGKALDKGKDMPWLLAKVAEPTKTQAALPLAMPETVIVEKGRPAKLYYLDPERPGCLQVHKNNRNELQMGGLVKTFFQLHYKRWIRRMRDMFGDAMPRGTHFETLQAKSEMLRITYQDGEILILSYGDVEKMIMTRAFTRQFWNPVSMLQTIPWLDGTFLSYHYSHVGAGQRAAHLGVKYAADVEPTRSGPPHTEWVNMEKKEPPVWSYSDVDLFEEDELEKPRLLPLPDTALPGRPEVTVEEIPDSIRAHLLERFWDLRNGTFEFIRDGHDGTLWLLNACRMKCVYKGPPEEFIDPVKQEEERLAKLVRYFREDEWIGSLEAHSEKVRRSVELDPRSKERVEYATRELGRAKERADHARRNGGASAPADEKELVYAHEGLSMRERVELSMCKFKDKAGDLSENISAEVQAVMAAPPRIIPVFTGTNRKELHRWFNDLDPVEKPDPVAGVIRDLALEPPPKEGEAVEIPKSDSFKAQPLDFTVGLPASKERDVIAWNGKVGLLKDVDGMKTTTVNGTLSEKEVCRLEAGENFALAVNEDGYDIEKNIKDLYYGHKKPSPSFLKALGSRHTKIEQHNRPSSLTATENYKFPKIGQTAAVVDSRTKMMPIDTGRVLLRNRSASFVEESGTERERTTKAFGSRMLTSPKRGLGTSSRSTTPSASLPVSPSRSRLNASASGLSATRSSFYASSSRPTTNASSSQRLMRTASAVF
jgi:hypothetical protein